MAKTSSNRCLSEVADLIGKSGDFTKSQVNKMLEDAAEKVERLINKHKTMDAPDVAAAVFKDIQKEAQDVKIRKAIAKRNQLLNQKATLQTIGYIKEVWGDLPISGMKAILRGVATPRFGAYDSVSRAQTMLVSKYHSALYSDLVKGKVWSAFKDGSFDKDIYIARSKLDKGEDVSGLHKEAVDIAKILHKHQEYWRKAANEKGGYIGKLDGYVSSRSHDSDKIRGNKDGWLKYMRDNIDPERTFSDLDPAKVDEELIKLRHAFILNKHLSSGGDGVTSGMASVARGMSHERVIHFKTPEAEYEYSVKFGIENLSKSIFFDSERLAAETALMSKLGPNAKTNLDNIFNSLFKMLEDEGRTEEAQKLINFKSGTFGVDKALFPVLTGENRAIVSPTIAKASSMLTALQQSASLGKALLSMFSDLAMAGSNTQYQGRSFFSGIGEGLQSLAQGRTHEEYLDILSGISVIADGINGSVIARFGNGDPLSGKTAAAMQMFWKYTGIQWWPDRIREGINLGYSHWLAQNSTKNYADLPEELQRIFTASGFKEDDWNSIIRHGVEFVEGDERGFMTATGFQALDDTAYSKVLQNQGIDPTPARIKDLRGELDDKFRIMMQEMSQHGLIEGNHQVTALLSGGGPKGTYGSLMRGQFALFKSFPIAVVQKFLGRMLYGYSTSGKAEITGSAISNFSKTMAAMTLLGYMSMTAKDLAKGRTYRDPTEPEVWGAAFMQGGGLGIFGDFLFSEANRFGGNIATTVGGPTVSDIGSLYNIWGRIRSGEGDKAANETFKFAVNNMPGANFYWRPTLDALFINDVSEYLSPGYLKRVEKRAKEQHQDFLWKPTQARLHLFD